MSEINAKAEALRLEGMDLKRFQFMLEHIADGWFPFTLAAHSMTNWRTPDQVRAIIDAEIARRRESPTEQLVAERAAWNRVKP